MADRLLASAHDPRVAATQRPEGNLPRVASDQPAPGRVEGEAAEVVEIGLEDQGIGSGRSVQVPEPHGRPLGGGAEGRQPAAGGVMGQPASPFASKHAARPPAWPLDRPDPGLSRQVARGQLPPSWMEADGSHFGRVLAQQARPRRPGLERPDVDPRTRRVCELTALWSTSTSQVLRNRSDAVAVSRSAATSRRRETSCG